MSTFPEHDRKVSVIAAAVRERARAGARVHVSKGGVSHLVPLPDDGRLRSPPIDISPLSEVLEIDAGARTCECEPGVTFARLVAATLRHGLIPTVVPELEGISVGGAVAGCSVEAMSYRYGGFHDSCLEYEVVDGSGDVVTCSPERDPLVFHMLHGSLGTLGILARLKFRLVPAKPIVHLRYRRLRTASHFHAEMLRRCAAADYDFVDGIIHGPDEHVLCLGRFVDDAPYLSDYRWLDIFYQSTRTRSEDYLETADYCFRYDTECHWLTRTVPPLEWKPVRLAVGKLFLGSTNLIRWSKRVESVLKLKRRPDVVCDVFIPSRNYLEFYRWYEETFRYFPLWIVPYHIASMYPWVSAELAARMKDDLFIDCAVYGKPNSEEAVDYSRLLEEKTFELDGIKTLIGRNHYTVERFWQVYHRPNYTSVKGRLDPHGVFPDLCDSFHHVE
jgi:FAD/FMN-containing dehydrogenase